MTEFSALQRCVFVCVCVLFLFIVSGMYVSALCTFLAFVFLQKYIWKPKITDNQHQHHHFLAQTSTRDVSEVWRH